MRQYFGFVSGLIAAFLAPMSYANPLLFSMHGSTAAPILFADSCKGATINPAWNFLSGTWSQSGGALHQTSTGNENPRRAVVVNRSFPANHILKARVRVDSWTDGAWATAGIALYADTTTGHAYNLVFHNDTGTVQFLNDYVVWGNAYAFTWTIGTWYWFALMMYNGTLYGKVWAEGTPEPTDWPYSQSGWSNRSSAGAPGLHGGAAGGVGNSTVSFADVTVTPATNPQPNLLTVAGCNASGAYMPCANAYGTPGIMMWNHGGNAPAWLQYDLGALYSVKRIDFLGYGVPAGAASIDVYMGPTSNPSTYVGTATGANNGWFSWSGNETGVRYIVMYVGAFGSSWVGLQAFPYR